MKLHEFYTVDVDKTVEEFRRRISSNLPITIRGKSDSSFKEEMVIIQDPNYGRRTCTVDMNIAVRLYNLARYSSIFFVHVLRCTYTKMLIHMYDIQSNNLLLHGKN